MRLDPVELFYYQTDAARSPFRDWLHSLDRTAQQVIDVRLQRLRRGLFGDTEPVGGGVFELKVHFGPGYRIYFGREGRLVVVLLHGGDKRRQSADVERAQGYWNDYLGRTGK